MFTSNEAAEELQIDPSRIRKLCRAKRMGTKIGRDWMITAAELKRYRKIGKLKPGRKSSDN